MVDGCIGMYRDGRTHNNRLEIYSIACLPCIIFMENNHVLSGEDVISCR